MALRWIKDNIANFGGDTDRITIYGISAGGWSVSAHMVSPNVCWSLQQSDFYERVFI